MIRDMVRYIRQNAADYSSVVVNSWYFASHMIDRPRGGEIRDKTIGIVTIILHEIIFIPRILSYNEKDSRENFIPRKRSKITICRTIIFQFFSINVRISSFHLSSKSSIHNHKDKRLVRFILVVRIVGRMFDDLPFIKT